MRLLPVAHHFSEKVAFVMSDEVEYAEELGELGMKDAGDDVVIALWGGPKEKYVLKEDFDDYSLSNFIEVNVLLSPT